MNLQLTLSEADVILIGNLTQTFEANPHGTLLLLVFVVVVVLLGLLTYLITRR